MSLAGDVESPSSYRAWQWHDGSEPRMLALDQLDMPPLAAGDVLVRNAIIGLNPVDWKVLGKLPWEPGHVPGVDGAGTVVALGAGVAGDWVGQRVAYHQDLQRHGSFAEYTPLAARALLRLPDAVDFETAASFPCPALTAWLALEKVPVRAGQALLVSGAGGAVGHYLVQLAVARGFSVTTMSHPRHWERLLALGADDCLSGPQAPGATWPEDGKRFFGVVDTVNGTHARGLATALRANGHLVAIQDRVPDWPLPPFGKAISLHEVALGALHQHGDDADWAQLTAAGERLLQEFANGRLRPEATVVRDFAALPDLLEALRQRQFSGKPLIRI
ncbi:zinc-binding dehydrogenase [Tatumella ptyseos]|uniref:zinc-binding dehydrogenase n=1 Tax=Tatumella ptyseos TaxID=82987 RepID=UPI0026EB4BC7|nr:zinc-binding dehydrogenase [Tatumella ptyseos]WKX25771.1 zinc-binding dehydrogenase [Tatumella ptyseos]